MSDELPNGWATAQISEVTQRVPNIKPEDSPEKDFGYVDISSINNSSFVITDVKQIKGRDAPSRARRPIRPNDVIFSNVRTYLRNIALVGPECGAEVCSTGFTVLRPNAAVEPRFLFRYVLTDQFLDRVTPQQTGTHYPATSDKVVMSEAIPLAPLAEQRRIVAKLEKLLRQVDVCHQRLEEMPTLLKRFRQSVLAAACSGRLTADWRKENPTDETAETIVGAIRQRREAEAKTDAQKEKLREIFSVSEGNDSKELAENWRFVALNKLCSSFNYGTSAKSQPSGKIPVLRMGNIQDGEIDWSDLVYTSNANEIESYSLRPNTVLFNRANSPELVGKTAIYRGEQPAIFAGYLIRINPFKELDPEYLNFCLNTNYAKGFCLRVRTDGVSQSNINAQKVGAFELPFCPLAEQQEIVRRVEGLFALADQLEMRLAQACEQVDKLTPALLARAFAGQLVPQEPNDEPASVLLNRIGAQREMETRDA